MAKQDIVVIGGSAGSNSALKLILSALPEDIPASFFIATHVSSTSDYLTEYLAKVSSIPVRAARDGLPIEQGCVYVAVPDHHLLVIDGTLRLGDGPRENMARPAIDPLFRSAALSYGPRTVGVILSGLLNDGASGLWAVKACGGTAIVQHPLDCAADQMPLAALEAVDADEVAPAEELARVLADVISRDANGADGCPDAVALEVKIAGGDRFADPSALTCPECQGVLSEIRGQHPLRYRCQIGHAQTAEVLAEKRERVDEAMSVALRVMEERLTLVLRMGEDARKTGRTAVAELYEARAVEYQRYTQILREAAVASLHDGLLAASEEL